MEKRGKKAELTTTQLVALIILIMSFAIILFLLFRMNLGEETIKEICHNSVVLVGKSELLGSLDCKTTYVCIGKECEDFNPTINVKAETKEEIASAIQKEIDDCWWMFGEGKIDYTLKTNGYHCAICSVIKFDKSLEEIEFNGEVLDSSEKYSVYTGMNDEIDLLAKDKYIESTIVQSNKISETKCNIFDITKA